MGVLAFEHMAGVFKIIRQHGARFV